MRGAKSLFPGGASVRGTPGSVGKQDAGGRAGENDGLLARRERGDLIVFFSTRARCGPSAGRSSTSGSCRTRQLSCA